MCEEREAAGYDSSRRSFGSSHRTSNKRSTGHSVARELTFANVLRTTSGVNRQNFYGSRYLAVAFSCKYSNISYSDTLTATVGGYPCWMPGEALSHEQSRFQRDSVDRDTTPPTEV